MSEGLTMKSENAKLTLPQVAVYQDEASKMLENWAK